MSILTQTDLEGHLLPWVGDDEVIECVEALNDPDYGDPSGWPERYDEAIWELGADPLPDEPTGPDPEDLDWLATLDCREAAQYQARLEDRYDAMYRSR